MGKTRLATRYAAAHDETHGRRFFTCDLTSAQTFDAVLGVIASAVGVTLGEAASTVAAVEQLRHALAALGDALLVIDNAEGHEGPLGAALEAWLRDDQGPVFLVTSRVRLRRRAERCIEIGPLTPADAADLFEDRARHFVPDFSVDDSTRELLARLDYNPLAIELAAARAHVLDPAALLSRFSRHLDLVRSAGGDASPRHASLRAVVDASWELCCEREQRALAALTIFRSGFGFEAAEALLSRLGLGETSDVLESLLAQSLIYRIGGPTSARARYVLYEAIRELAAERLLGWGDMAEASRALHADYYLGLASRHASAATNGAVAAIDALVAEVDDLLAAFRVAPRHAVALDAVFTARLTRSAHQELLSIALAHVGRSEPALAAELHLARAIARARGDVMLATLADAEDAWRLATGCGRADIEAHARLLRTVAISDLEGTIRSKEVATETLAFARSHRLMPVVGGALVRLGWSTLNSGQLAESERCAEEALAIATDAQLVGLQSLAHSVLGALAARSDVVSAERHFHLALSAARASRSWAEEIKILGHLARVATQTGDRPKAREYLRQALDQARIRGFRRGEGVQLAQLATSLLDEGDLVEAHAHAAQAARILGDLGYRRYEAAARYTLSCIALEQGKLELAEASLLVCIDVGSELADASLTGPARATLAAVLSQRGDWEGARDMLQSARELVDERSFAPIGAIVDIRAGLMEVERARVAFASGEHSEAAAAVAGARRTLEHTRALDTVSADVRVARRLLERACADIQRAWAADVAPQSSSSYTQTGRYEVVMRSGVSAHDVEPAPSGFDLYFDALKARVVVDGDRVSDLRKKPIAARLLEVLLCDPSTRFDKSSLFERAWHAQLRTASQGATLYKAVDRLARLLDPDPRRFLRWDEQGRLVLVAERPGLSRLRCGPHPVRPA